MLFQEIPRNRKLVHRQPTQIMLQWINFGTINVCTKHDVNVIDVRGIHREFLDHVIAHHIFEVFPRWMSNNSLRFASELRCGNIFFGEPSKIFWTVFTKAMYFVFLESMYGRPILYLLKWTSTYLVCTV